MSKKLDVNTLIMPKATAVWLIENTAIGFQQIADFTGLHSIEVEALANEEVGRGIVGRNPVDNNELTKDELEKAEADPSYVMTSPKRSLPAAKIRSKGPKYTPVSKRGDKPDAIAYILKHNPEISDAQIVKIIGTTKATIQKVRDRTHPNISAIKPRHPVDIGLCTYAELEAASDKGLRAQGIDPAQAKKEAEEKAAAEAQAQQQEEDSRGAEASMMAGFDFSNFMSSAKTGTDDQD